jgi:hypothetical protein
MRLFDSSRVHVLELLGPMELSGSIYLAAVREGPMELPAAAGLEVG